MLHRIADRDLDSYARAFVEEFAGLEVDDVQLRAALDRAWTEIELARNRGAALVPSAAALDDVAAALGLNRASRRLAQRYTRLIGRTFNAAGDAMARLGPKGFRLAFDRTNPRATRFAARQSSRLVREVSKQTRRAIRREIARGFRQGITVPETARTLRSIVGLTEKQAATATRFRDEWLPDMNARVLEDRPLLSAQTRRLKRINARRPTPSRPYGADEIARIGDKYSAKLLRDRATAIARTETIRSSAGGQVELWKQSADDGLLDLEVFRQKWVYTKDARTECSCKSIPRLNPQGVKLGEPFRMEDCKTGEIRLVYLPGDTHPLCRCGLVAVFHQDEADVEEVVA